MKGRDNMMRLSGLLILTFALTAPINQARSDNAAIALGKKVFLELAVPQCALCHTLADAGSTGPVGPVLDDLKPTADRVRTRLVGNAGLRSVCVPGRNTRATTTLGPPHPARDAPLHWGKGCPSEEDDCAGASSRVVPVEHKGARRRSRPNSRRATPSAAGRPAPPSGRDARGRLQ